MWIVNKERNATYNFDRADRIFITGSNCIKMAVGDTVGGVLGDYDTSDHTRAALAILMSAIGTNSRQVVYMPTDQEVEMSLRANQTPWHHATGKKTKGHGGS